MILFHTLIYKLQNWIFDSNNQYNIIHTIIVIIKFNFMFDIIYTQYTHN